MTQETGSGGPTSKSRIVADLIRDEVLAMAQG